MSSSIDVLIVGGGPTGLMLACQLALYPNVSFRIIDKNPGCTTQSRALVVHARSLELLAQLNLVEEALSKGEFAEKFKIFIQGQCRLDIDLTRIRTDQKPLLSRYPYLLLIEQSVTEQLLEKYLNEHHIQVERNTEAIDFNSLNENFVEVKLANGEIIRTKYVCACDGAKSIVRHKLNLSFSGRTYSSALFIADCHVDNLPIQKHQAAIFFASAGLCGIFPIGNNRYRLFGTIEENQFHQANIDFNDAVKIIKTCTLHPQINIKDCNWLSIYRSHHRHITTFRYEKQFFLLGDAAHIHSPVGGQGMNTGLQDAHNLAWKLAYVLTHSADDRLLDTYHDERSIVAETLVNTTDRAFAFFSNPRGLTKFIRLHIFPYLLRFMVQPLLNYSQKCRQFFFQRLSQLGINYRSSQTSSKASSAGSFHRTVPQPGDRFPYAIYDPRYYHFVIFEKEQTSKVLLFIELIKQKYSNFIQIHETREENIPLQFEGAVLIRPDGFVAYRTRTFDIEHFQLYFGQFFSYDN